MILTSRTLTCLLVTLTATVDATGYMYSETDFCGREDLMRHIEQLRNEREKIQRTLRATQNGGYNGCRTCMLRVDVQRMGVEIDELENKATTFRNSTVESVREALKRVRDQGQFSNSAANFVRCNHRKRDLEELLKQIHVARDRAITESGRLPKDLTDLLITFFYFPPRPVDEVKQEISKVLKERSTLMGRMPLEALRRIEGRYTGFPQQLGTEALSSNQEALHQLSTRLNTLDDELDEICHNPSIMAEFHRYQSSHELVCK